MIMRIPGFTAETSLYKANKRHRSRVRRSEPQQAGVSPQLGDRDRYKGFSGCVSDCLDSHPHLTPAQCARNCRDPFAGVDLSTRGSWFNDLLSDAGISFWEAGCKINPYTGSIPYLCGSLANLMRRQS